MSQIWSFCFGLYRYRPTEEQTNVNGGGQRAMVVPVHGYLTFCQTAPGEDACGYVVVASHDQ